MRSGIRAIRRKLIFNYFEEGSDANSEDLDSVVEG